MKPRIDKDLLRKTTAPKLLCERAKNTPDAIAFRSKDLGLYRERTWRVYADMVARTASMLSGLGLSSGDRIAIMGDVCEEWVVCDLASQTLGAIVYGIYPTASASEVEYQMRDGGASIFVAEDQEHVDKILPNADKLPNLKWIVVIDDTAMFDYEHPKLVRYSELLEKTAQPDLNWLVERADRVKADAPAFIVYSSGTTGHPKGVLVLHGKHLAAAANLIEHYPTLLEKDHRTVVYLPICHVLGRDVAVSLPLMSRLVPHYGEDPEDLISTFFEIAPTLLITVPRYLQKFASNVLVGVLNSSIIKRGAYNLATKFARNHVRRRWEGKTNPIGNLLFAICSAAVFRPILNKIGFDQLELVISGGAPLPADTMTFWQMYGINVVEIYGQTETAGGIIAGQTGLFPRPGDVGTPPPGWEVVLADTGEILVRCPDLFENYWNNPAATGEVKQADGFMRTGDVGQYVGRSLKLVDRARDFIVTLGGKTISPSSIENVIRASPYVAEVVVIGHGRKYLTALIEIDFDTVADWARRHNVTYSGFTSLAANAQTQSLIEAEIEKANKEFARVEQVKRFSILPKALDPEEDGEPITPTRKVKRQMMIARFKDLVDAMYDDREERLIAAAAGGSR